MFLEFYKLREQPFGVTPDPRFLYFGSTHREAFASLVYAIETKRGFSALVAEPGMGKTSLLFRMLDSLKGSARTAFLFQTEGDSRELLRSLLSDFGIKMAGQDPVAMHQALNEELIRELHGGRQVVVVIDEAQNLDEKVLETIRLLSNFETSTQKLMHIVLAGQPGLATKLSGTAMTQLRQRVSTMIRLEPFHDNEVSKYIQHRLRAGGHEGPSIFSPDAIEMITRISHGIPRNINSLCFQALSLGFATQSRQIGAEIVRDVASDLDFAPKCNDRIKPPETIRWSPVPTESPRFSGNSRLGVWDQPEFTPSRSSRGKWLAAMACLAILPVTVIALSDTRLGLTETLPGRVSAQMVNAVLNSKDPNADFVPAWPEKLEAPSPPRATEATNTVSEASTSSADGDSRLASADASGMSGIAGEPNQNQPARSASAARNNITPAAPYEGRAHYDNQNRSGPVSSGLRSTPAAVQVLRSETVFQFALELYGQSNWKVVEAICAANPGIHDPYSVLKAGEWVRLPSDLVTVTAKYGSSATTGRLR
jgi:type II secretory pathway predicted ATPase ExeA/phage tail protein X